MVSLDHYAHVLRNQLNNAFADGSQSIVIDAGELHRSTNSSYDFTEQCWRAMEEEMTGRDQVVVLWLSVRYFLPRI
jgi:hypothetical protein